MPKTSRDEVLKSAVAFTKLLVEKRPSGTLDKHLKELLNVLVWKATEADGKYNTRYVSEGFHKDPKQKCEHEHVIEKKKIIARIIENPAHIEDLLRSAVACLVLEDEHERLTKLAHTHPDLEGWDRYKQASIRVYDTIEKKFLW